MENKLYVYCGPLQTWITELEIKGTAFFLKQVNQI